MKKLFENGWITAACMFTVALSDLVFLTIKDVEFGLGFVLAMTYLVIHGIRSTR